MCPTLHNRYIRHCILDSSLKMVDTYRHLSAFPIVLNVNMLIVGSPAPGVASVAEAARLVDLAVAAEGLVVIVAHLSPGIDLRVADVHANAFGGVIVDSLKLSCLLQPMLLHPTSSLSSK